MRNVKISLDNIEVTSNARFFKLNKPLSKKVIETMFRNIISSKNGSRISIKEPLRDNSRENGIFISCLVFYSHKNPTFIKQVDFLKEKKYSYMLLIEMNGMLVVSSLNTPGIYKYLKRYIEELGYEVIANTFSDMNPTYEKVSSQNISLLGNKVRKKTLEGRTLEAQIDGHNSIPLSVSLRTDNMKNSISISTSRISSNNGRDNIREFIDWAKIIIAGIKSSNKDNFINTFAAPVKLDEISKKNLQPMGILLNLHDIEAKIFENENDNFKIRSKDKNGTFCDIDETIIRKLFDTFRESLLIAKLDNKRKYKINVNDYNAYLTITTKNILIIIRELNDYYLYNSDTGEHQRIRNLINQEQNFTIIFNDSNYIYTTKELFFNKGIFNNIESLYSIIETYDVINNCTNEKFLRNTPHQNDTGFHENTLFGIVEKTIWNQKGHLICDDLGDEWADHISIYSAKTQGEIPNINFYISKHGDNTTTSASKFHDVIGQAHKNIGNINFKEEDILRKISLWENSNYGNTQISKLRSNNGGWDSVKQDFIDVLENPLTIRNMYLVVSFLSLSKLKNDISSYRDRQKGLEHIPQLIWFIHAFIDQCKEHNVKPHIVCKP